MDLEKFCLKWNDFEENINTAFRELREDKDFFDVTLACDDSKQVQAHKVILSACSPFFKTVLKRNRHEHPLLYLKGVKYAELVAVLNFMYLGEVNVAQEELNTFLSVAEDLKVKGLTQDKSPNENLKSTTHDNQPNKTILGRSNKTPAPKKFKPSTDLPLLITHKSTTDEDNIQVHHIKSEPALLHNAPLDSIADLPPSYSYTAAAGSGQDTAVMEDSGNSDIYGGFGDYYKAGEGYDNSMVTDPTDMEGCKDISYLEETISGLMTHSKDVTGGIFWHCGMCDMQMKRKHNMKRHVEAFHVSGFVHSCNICGSKHKTKAAVEAHMYQKHREHGLILD